MQIYFISNLYSFLDEQLNFFDGLQTLAVILSFSFRFDCFDNGDRFIADVDEAEFFIVIIICVYSHLSKKDTTVVLEAELDIRSKCTRNPERTLCTDRVFFQTCSYYFFLTLHNLVKCWWSLWLFTANIILMSS